MPAPVPDRTVSVRAATTTDAAALARVHVRAWQAAYRGVMPDAFLDALDADRRAAAWARHLREDDTSGLVVAVSGSGEVVGFAEAAAARDEATGDDGELVVLNVDPADWGTGAGTALLLAAQAHLVARGHRTATLWVAAGNARARTFYERHGWRPDGVSRAGTVGGASTGGTVEVAELRYATVLVPAGRD